MGSITLPWASWGTAISGAAKSPQVRPSSPGGSRDVNAFLRKRGGCQYCLILRHVSLIFRFAFWWYLARFHTLSPREFAIISNIAHRHRPCPMPLALSASALQQCMLGRFGMLGQAWPRFGRAPASKIDKSPSPMSKWPYGKCEMARNGFGGGNRDQQGWWVVVPCYIYLEGHY